MTTPDNHTQRLTAALADRYRIEKKLGEGGMASVYLAEDVKHERKVALKILKPELAAVIGAERFLSEIKTTANLQHPPYPCPLRLRRGRRLPVLRDAVRGRRDAAGQAGPGEAAGRGRGGAHHPRGVLRSVRGLPQGTLLYTSEGGYVGSVQTLTTVGLDGSVEVESLEPRFFESPRWSPDGRFVAYGGTEAGTTSADPQIYSYDMVAKSRPRRLTSVGTNRLPVWSPDGKTLVFTSQREGTDVGDLFLKTVADDSRPRLLLSMPGFQFASDWISEREILIGGGASGRQIWIVELPAEGSGDSVTARPYFESADQHEPAYLAAQGDLITYSSSDATGAWEVYTRSFPVPGSPEKITEGGGDVPHWSRDGNTIYYLSSPRGDSLWAAHIDRGPPFAVVDAVPVISWSYGLRAFDLHPDGDRIITTGSVSQSQATGGGEDGAAAVPSRSFLVTNWFTELKARLREGGGR